MSTSSLHSKHDYVNKLYVVSKYLSKLTNYIEWNNLKFKIILSHIKALKIHSSIQFWSKSLTHSMLVFEKPIIIIVNNF